MAETAFRGATATSAAIDPNKKKSGLKKTPISVDDFTEKMLSFGPEGPPPDFDFDSYDIIGETAKPMYGPGDSVSFDPPPYAPPPPDFEPGTWEPAPPPSTPTRMELPPDVASELDPSLFDPTKYSGVSPISSADERTRSAWMAKEAEREKEDAFVRDSFDAGFAGAKIGSMRRDDTPTYGPPSMFEEIPSMEGFEPDTFSPGFAGVSPPAPAEKLAGYGVDEEGMSERTELERLIAEREALDPLWRDMRGGHGGSRYVVKGWRDPARPAHVEGDPLSPHAYTVSHGGGMDSFGRAAGLGYAEGMGSVSGSGKDYWDDDIAGGHISVLDKRHLLGDREPLSDEKAAAYMKGVSGITKGGDKWYGTPEAYAAGEAWLDPYTADWDPETKTFSHDPYAIREIYSADEKRMVPGRHGYYEGGRDIADLELGSFIGKTPVYRDIKGYGGKRAVATSGKYVLDDGTEVTGWGGDAAYKFLPKDYEVLKGGDDYDAYYMMHPGIGYDPAKHSALRDTPGTYIGGYRYPSGSTSAGLSGLPYAEREARMKAFYGDEIWDAMRSEPRDGSSHWLSEEALWHSAREKGLV